jgi:hypothetical protein
MEAITAERSLLLTEEEQLEGTTTISLETQGETEQGIWTYIHENFADFLRIIRLLSREDQEYLLAYYVLGKSQDSLAAVYRITQTVCSMKLRILVKTLCCMIVNGGVPSAAQMKPILEKVGMETLLSGIGMSECIEHYQRVRSFKAISTAYHIHPPDVRRNMRVARRTLLESTDVAAQTLGAYLTNLIDKSNPTGTGLSKRELAKAGDIIRSDPACLGEFRVRVEDADFEKVFSGRANIFS